MKQIFTFLVFTLICTLSFAQDFNLKIAEDHIQEKYQTWGLQESDIQEYKVSDNYTSKKSGVNHIYFIQMYKGIPINNAITTVNVTKEGKVLYSSNRFEDNLADRVVESKASLNPEQAITNALLQLGETWVDQPVLIKNKENGIAVYQCNTVYNEINVGLSYQPVKGGKIILAYDMALDLKSSPDYWSVRVDAATGEIISKNNWTLYCNVDHIYASHATHNCKAHQLGEVKQSFEEKSITTGSAAVSGSYLVYPFPAESPLETPQTVVVNPHNPIASPFGWHDLDGEDGADVTNTEGNNVRAYLDVDDNNAADAPGPDGGDALIFDASHNDAIAPQSNQDAAQINLFYAINFVHDFVYVRGFDEEAGNFQFNNYGAGGFSGDPVLGEAQDGSGTNNANFATPADGGSGRMQMFLWDRATSGDLRIDSPGNISGVIGQSGLGEFGPIITDSPVTGAVSPVDDGIGIDVDGCQEITNDLTDKVAMIERGGCFFWEKILNAQQAGAIAALVCNIPGADSPSSDGEIVLAGMNGDPTEPITIPSLFVAKSTCDKIKAGLTTGEEVLMTFQSVEIGGPTQLDASYDNGVIAHEYGHGVSNRLTGGPSAANCLGNDEQMGEGWSDFLTLVTTAKPEHTRATARGIGTYVNDEDINGRGIRTFPYGDFSVNPQTYEDIVGTTAPHPLGAVWNQMLWDVYWFYVETYGFDESWTDENKGNVIAVEIVIEAMKIQGCSPGFADGRDALLSADFVRYGDIHQLSLWQIFADRGLGFSANSNSNDRNSANEEFDIPPVLIPTLKVNKEIPQLLEPGEEIEIKINVANHIDSTVLNVVLTDELPDGVTYIDGSASMDVSLGSQMLSFDLGDLAFDQKVEISYKALVDPNISSTTAFYDDLENDFDRWAIGEDNEGSSSWLPSTSNPRSGATSWAIRENEEETDQRLIYGPFTVTGANPAFKFYHSYNTQAIFDAGILQISTNGGDFWESITEDQFLRGEYNAFVDYSTFVIPSLKGWSGQSDGYVDAFIDMSDYAGQEVMISWRYGSDATIFGAAAGEGGWNFDDIELISDLLMLETNSTVTYDGGPDAVVNALTEVIVNSAPVGTAVVDAAPDFFAMSVYPNPTSDKMYVSIAAKADGPASMGLFSIDGRLIQQLPIYLEREANLYQMNVSDVAKGLYFVKVQSNFGTVTQKITVK